MSMKTQSFITKTLVHTLMFLIEVVFVCPKIQLFSGRSSRIYFSCMHLILVEPFW